MYIDTENSLLEWDDRQPVRYRSKGEWVTIMAKSALDKGPKHPAYKQADRLRKQGMARDKRERELEKKLKASQEKAEKILAKHRARREAEETRKGKPTAKKPTVKTQKPTRTRTGSQKKPTTKVSPSKGGKKGKTGKAAVQPKPKPTRTQVGPKAKGVKGKAEAGLSALQREVEELKAAIHGKVKKDVRNAKARAKRRVKKQEEELKKKETPVNPTNPVATPKPTVTPTGSQKLPLKLPPLAKAPEKAYFDPATGRLVKPGAVTSSPKEEPEEKQEPARRTRGSLAADIMLGVPDDDDERYPIAGSKTNSKLSNRSRSDSSNRSRSDSSNRSRSDSSISADTDSSDRSKTDNRVSANSKTDSSAKIGNRWFSPSAPLLNININKSSKSGDSVNIKGDDIQSSERGDTNYTHVNDPISGNKRIEVEPAPRPSRLPSRKAQVTNAVDAEEIDVEVEDDPELGIFGIDPREQERVEAENRKRKRK